MVSDIFLENESGIPIPDGFLPFGLAHGDSIGPRADDGSSEEIRLASDVVIFGLRHNLLYVSQIHAAFMIESYHSREHCIVYNS